MNNIRFLLQLLFFIVPIASAAPYFEKTAPPSLADHLHLSRSTTDEDKGWLPNLTGLPGHQQVLLAEHFIDAMKEEKDAQCTAIGLRLRKMMFQHFLIYQQMANAQHIYLDDKIAHQWAHVLAMIVKESGGDSTDITDMKGQSISTNTSKTNLHQWKKIESLKPNSRIPMNYQTNFGLTQISADRLFNAFHLAKNQQYDTAFLEGKEGADTPRKITLNTAIAIRRLIWFYQGVAEGRLTETEQRIPEADNNQPGLAARYQNGLKMALVYCGTDSMFSEGFAKNSKQDNAKLLKAMASIAYCKLGDPQTGYGMNEIEQECFAKWVTLCPALNVDIASLTPLSYFATRNVKPACENTFKQLINKKPVIENNNQIKTIN